MPKFEVVSEYTPSGDQPEAIQALAEALHSDTIKNFIAEKFDGAVIAVD